MGHRFYGKRSDEARERLIVSVDGFVDTAEIVAYLKAAGAHGLIEEDLGITTILVSCPDRAQTRKALMELWGDLPGFEVGRPSDGFEREVMEVGR